MSAVIVGRVLMLDDFGSSLAGRRGAFEGEMTLDDALAVVKCDDSIMLRFAGMAVLRLKLLEVSHVLAKPRLPEDIRVAAQTAVVGLKRLITERPGVSMVDYAAREKVLGPEAPPASLPRPERAPSLFCPRNPQPSPHFSYNREGLIERFALIQIFMKSRNERPQPGVRHVWDQLIKHAALPE